MNVRKTSHAGWFAGLALLVTIDAAAARQLDRVPVRSDVDWSVARTWKTPINRHYEARWGQDGPWADQKPYAPRPKPVGWVDPEPSKWPWTGERDPYDYDRVSMGSEVNWLLKQMAKASTSELPIVEVAQIEPAELPGPDVLSAIVAWLAVISDLPAIYDHPRIERASQVKMTAMRYRELLSQSQLEMAVISQAMSRHHILAVYDDASKTIYLADAWTGSTPAEQSILVHEMVHHLQNLAGRTYGCPQEREQLAYDAQNRWLALYERDLERDFDIDKRTLLVSIECMP